MSSLALAVSEAVIGRPRTRATALARRAAMVVMGVLLIAGAAQVHIPLPFTPVPITGQTFAVLLVAAALGRVDGTASAAAYVLAGGAGLPFYAGAASGWAVLGGATGGYLAGFVASAFVVGSLADRGWTRAFPGAVATMLTGTVLIYLCGMVWLARVLGVSPVSEKALLAGLYPFVIGDLIKVYAAAALLPAAWRLARSD